MATLLQEMSRTETPRGTLTRVPRGPLKAAGEHLLALTLGVANVVVQVLLYAAIVLMIPVVPFVLPLLMGPVVILWGLTIQGAGKVLALLGWL